jgi:3'(2'), 5'-bisphosphate nucleotidase
MNELDRLARAFIEIASEAGAAIMPLFRGRLASELKKDRSPVTEADRRSHETIADALTHLLPGVPIISEEGASPTAFEDAEFFLVDPLDGTKEFLAGKTQFTVNLALIRRERPVAGVVYAPALEMVYFAGSRAWAAPLQPGRSLTGVPECTPLCTRPYSQGGLAAVASSSHPDPETDRFLSGLPITSYLAAGSSLKFCYVAAGQADVYPRFGPTMEWDTAAGQAVVEAAGGQVLTSTGASLRYGKFDNALVNDAFVAWGREPYA